MKITKHYNGIVGNSLKILGFGAITIGSHIWFADKSQEVLLPHEMIHVEQYKRYGFLNFIGLYLFYLLVYGYKDNPLEIEAITRGGI